MRSIQWLLASLAVTTLAGAVHAGSPTVGEYSGGFAGMLTIKPTTKPDRFSVRLGVGMGSCGGEVWIDDKTLVLRDNQMSQSYRLKGKPCKTTLALDGNDIRVSDSCITDKDEANSTCAMLGVYSRSTK